MTKRAEHFKKYYQAFVGREIGGYILKKLIGVGGMGAIFLAYNQRMDIEVAMKILLPEYAHNDEYVERFFREARSAFKLIHNNIVKVHHADVIDKENIVYMTMDLIVGSSLKDIIRIQKKLSISGSIKIITQTLKGLSYAHQSEDKIVHRDIKPDNILIDKQGTVKIADFGLARGISVKDNITLTGGQILGTPSYMSLEQWDSEKTDARSDIYSTGVTFYYILTGQYPYKHVPGATIWSIRTAMVNSSPELPSTFNPEIDIALENIIMKMLERDVDKRYQTCDEVLADLYNWQKKLTDDVDLSTLILNEDIQLKTKRDSKKGIGHQTDKASTTSSSSIQLTPKKALLFSSLLIILGIGISIFLISILKADGKNILAANPKSSKVEIKPNPKDESIKPENTESKEPQHNTEVNNHTDENDNEADDPKETEVPVKSDETVKPVETAPNPSDVVDEPTEAERKAEIDNKNYNLAKAALEKGNPKLIREYIKNTENKENRVLAKQLLSAKDNETFEKATTIEELETYLRTFEDALNKIEAEAMLNQLKDELETSKKLIEELNQLRDSKNVIKLREFINSLSENLPLRTEAENLYTHIHNERWLKAKNADDPEILIGFSKDFPASEHLKEIPKLVDEIEEELILKARITNDEASWKNYLTKFPDGKSYIEAILKISYPAGFVYPDKAPQIPSKYSRDFSEFTKNNNFWETTREKDGMQMIYIPPGRLFLGEIGGKRVYIEIKPFLMDKYEVTVSQYKQFCEETLKRFPLDSALGYEEFSKPITDITYKDALDFSKWVKGSLPTEIEFLFAALGADETQKNLIKNTKNINVASKNIKSVLDISDDVSIFGVIGLAGNASEMCFDKFSDDWIKSLFEKQLKLFENLNLKTLTPLQFTNANIFTGLTKDYRNLFGNKAKEVVIRGASFLSKRSTENPDFSRNFRKHRPADFRSKDLGFRTITYLE